MNQIKALDPATWPAHSQLIERHQGFRGGCWCTRFHADQGASGSHRELKVYAQGATVSFLYNGTRTLFERATSRHDRPMGKNHCVTSLLVAPERPGSMDRPRRPGDGVRWLTTFLAVVGLGASCATAPASVPGRAALVYHERHQTTGYTCSTEALAVALSSVWGRPFELTEDELWKLSGARVVDIEELGNDMDALVRVCDRFGVRSRFVTGMSLTDLEAQVARGNPVLINIRPDPLEPASHTVVVVGYDHRLSRFDVADPAGRLEALAATELEARWSAHLSHPPGHFSRSALVVFRPSQTAGSAGHR